MKRRHTIAAGLIALVFLMTALGCGYYGTSGALVEQAGQMAAQTASEKLGVPVEVGSIRVESGHSLLLEDIAVYDKQAKCIARADSARIGFSLLSVLKESPLAAVDEVELQHVEAVLEQHEDGSWNVTDLQSESDEEIEFRGRVVLRDGTLTGRAKGKELVLEQMEAEADFGDYPVMKLEATANNQGAELSAKGTVSRERQIVHAEASGVELENYLAFVPQGLLPEGIEIHSGRVESLQADVMNYHDMLSFSGRTEYSGGEVKVMDTVVRDIHGFASFTDSEVILSVDAEAEEQKAHAAGRISWNAGVPYLNLNVVAENFEPARVLRDIPFQGAVDAEARVTGTAANPLVDGKVKSAQGSVEGFSYANASAHVRYADNIIYWEDLHAEVFDGTVSGEGEVAAQTMDYTAHLKAENVEVSYLSEYIPDVRGRATVDLGLDGTGFDVSHLRVYGSAAAKNAFYRDFSFLNLSASFFVDGDDVTIDYASANMPNHSDVGIEGTIVDGRKLDLAFYGGHMDLSLISTLVPAVECTGFGDIKGEIHGDSSNPEIRFDFSALRGSLLKQPFDSLKMSLRGSLDEVHIDDFSLEKDGKERWQVTGYVGFAGEKKINLQADCMDARMEDIAALVAPDQPITGNVSNTIRFTGTLDNPQAAGFIYFHRGSYGGMLLSGMEGDYTLENGTIRLQDFHIYSPMVDMDLNGTVDPQTNLNLLAEVHDINLKRFQHKMPYEVSGHGTFEGHILGTLASPVFDGVLESPELVFNGQSLTDIHGRLSYKNDVLHLMECGFRQQDGRVGLDLSVDMGTKRIFGRADVEQFGIYALLALMNQNTEMVQGQLTSHMTFGGTLDNPAIHLEGEIPSGVVAGYDIHDFTLNLDLEDGIVYVKRMEGSQGAVGKLSMSGQADLDGPLNLSLSAQSLSLGLFTRLAGIEAEVVGLANIEATIGGYADNPSADVQLLATDGGIQGATFDAMQGQFQLKNGLVDVKELLVQKSVNQQDYRAQVKGIIPFKALTAADEEDVNDYEQFKLNISLDQADLSLLPVLSKHIDWALGATKGNLEVAGTLAHPRIYGNIAVPEGAMKFKEIRTPVTDMEMSVSFQGTSMTVDKFTGKMGEGSYELTGQAALDGRTPVDYDFTLRLDQLDVQSSAFRGPISAELRLDEGAFFRRRLPRISGSVTFDNCQVSFPSIPDTEGELPELLMDVDVNLGKKVHFYSAYLYDMYLTGNAHFEHTTRHPKSSGAFVVQRGGTINYLKTVFRIREGEARFNQVDSFLPSIHFAADTKLTQARVFLSLNGPLNEMDFKLTSTPEMGQTEIMKMLTLRDAYKNGHGELGLGDLLSVGLQMTVLSEIESSVRNFLFLDRFTIARGSGSAFAVSDLEHAKDDVYHIELGKYISDKVMLRYVHGVGDHTHRFGIQYDFDDHYGLTIEREGGDFIIGVEARMSF